MKIRGASYTRVMDQWNTTFAGGLPLLHPLQAWAERIAGDDWPDRRALQQLLDEAGVRVASGQPLRLVAPGGTLPYEIRVHESAELECRERNWHDLFNVLIWLAFPRAKAALNARHHAAWSADSAGGRGAVRDALTLLDESGLVVLSVQPALLQLIRDFQWKPLFWERRSEMTDGMCFLPFGHALCEKALSPYRGLTGQAVLLEAGHDVLALPAAERLAHVDVQLAARIADPQFMQSTRQLAPVPVLGIPGWCADNAAAGYYDDTAYFRPGRRGRQGSAAQG